MSERCTHLDVSEEAYSINLVTGKQEPAKVHLCRWMSDTAARLTDLPAWITRQLGGAIDPERDCPGCLGFKRARPRHEPELRPLSPEPQKDAGAK